MRSDTADRAAIKPGWGDVFFCGLLIVVATGLPSAWPGAGPAVRLAHVPPTEPHRHLHVDHHIEPLHRAVTNPAAHRFSDGGGPTTGLAGSGGQCACGGQRGQVGG